MTMIALTIPPFPVFIKGGEFTFSKGEKHFKRTYSVFDMLYVKTGTLFMQENDVKFDVKEGEYLILLPEREHVGYKNCLENTSFIWLHFTVLHGNYEVVSSKNIDWSSVLEKESTFTEPANYRFHIPQHGRVNRRELMEQMLENIIEIGSGQVHAPDEALNQQIQFADFFVGLQKEAFSIPSATEQVCEQAMKYIQEHYQQPIKMKDISAELLFHPDYITRCMHKTIGLTPNQYLTHIRFTQAKQLLVDTNEKISSIAKQVGIEDVTYFSKLFKKQEGITPMEYRRIVHRK